MLNISDSIFLETFGLNQSFQFYFSSLYFEASCDIVIYHRVEEREGITSSPHHLHFSTPYLIQWSHDQGCNFKGW